MCRDMTSPAAALEPATATPHASSTRLLVFTTTDTLAFFGFPGNIVKHHKVSLTAVLPTDDAEPGPADQLLGVGGDLAAVHPRQLPRHPAQPHHRHALVALHPRHVRPHHAGKIFCHRSKNICVAGVTCRAGGGRGSSGGGGGPARGRGPRPGTTWCPALTTAAPPVTVLGHFHPVNGVFRWSFAINYPLRKKVN